MSREGSEQGEISYRRGRGFGYTPLEWSALGSQQDAQLVGLFIGKTVPEALRSLFGCEINKRRCHHSKKKFLALLTYFVALRLFRTFLMT